MPNEPRNTHGTTLREQLKAAAQATAQEQDARKQARAQAKLERAQAKAGKHAAASHEAADNATAHAAKGKDGVTKRRASKAQVKDQQQKDQKSKEKSKRDIKASLKELKPLAAVKEFLGNLALGWRVLIVFAIAVGIVGAVMYPIGCTYYQALRQEQQLQAVLDAVNQRNDSIQSKNDELQTDEGIENQARQEYGWVKEDEHATVITNSADNAAEMPSQVDETKIEPPHTWYYDILDVIFQSKV